MPKPAHGPRKSCIWTSKTCTWGVPRPPHPPLAPPVRIILVQRRAVSRAKLYCGTAAAQPRHGTPGKLSLTNVAAARPQPDARKNWCSRSRFGGGGVKYQIQIPCFAREIYIYIYIHIYPPPGLVSEGSVLMVPQLGPQIDPKSLQEPSKIHPKSHLVFDHFFNRFLIDFRPQNHAKSTKHQSKNQPNSTTTKKSKRLKKHKLLYVFVATSAMSCFAEK